MTTAETQEIGIGYLKTFPGILKVAEEVVNFIGMVCIAASPVTAKGDAFIACSVIALIVTGAILMCYITQLVVKIQIPWYRIEFFFYAAWILFYVVVSALAVSIRHDAYIAGGVFGFIAAALYIADAYHKFRLVMSG